MQETVASLSINHLFNIKYVDSKPLFITLVVREIFHKFHKEILTNSSSLVSSLLGGSLTTWKNSCNLLEKKRKFYDFNNKKVFQRMQTESSGG